MAEKILIADDDLETLRLVGLMLQRQGYQIIAAQNGQQAVSLARTEKPDLIIVDVMMPDLDGYQVTRQIRQDSATLATPVLMFTAKSQVDDKVAGYEAGVDDYLTKPVHPVELVAHIRALLSRSKARGGTGPIERGYTLGILAARGGTGVSALALNLAITYHQKFKADVIASEIRPGQGSWGLDLGFSNPEGLSNLLNHKAAEITTTAIENELIRTTFGIRLLMASNRTKDTSLMTAQPQMEAILQQLPHLTSLVVLDIGHTYQPIYEKALSFCQEIILATEPQPAAVQHTRVLVSELMEKGFGRNKVLTVVLLNRLRADIQYSAAQIHETIGYPVEHVIPPAPEQAYQAAIRSVPLIYIQPEGLVAQQVGRLADSVAQRARK